MEPQHKPIIFCQDPETNTWHSPYGAWTIRLRPDTSILELVGPHAQVPTFLNNDGNVPEALELAQTVIETHHERVTRKPRPKVTRPDELSPVDRLVRCAGGSHRRRGNDLLPALGH
jgi:hypothetical protein